MNSLAVERATPARPIYQRARAPTAAELADIPWLQRLDADERKTVVRDLKVVEIATGELLCRVGRPATYWFGVIDGLLKMSNDTAMGVPITFTGVPPGGWFGEGTVIKREVYRYNIQALRKSLVAGLTVETFHWLLDRSIPFNRFITQQLNERLGQFIAAREIDRMIDADARVAHHAAGAGLPRRAVAAARQRGVEGAADAWLHPHRVRRRAGDRHRCAAEQFLTVSPTAGSAAQP
jgi:CRP/FNR family transcriptional regulator, cyclic AMP receptor protein